MLVTERHSLLDGRARELSGSLWWHSFNLRWNPGERAYMLTRRDLGWRRPSCTPHEADQCSQGA